MIHHLLSPAVFTDLCHITDIQHEFKMTAVCPVPECPEQMGSSSRPTATTDSSVPVSSDSDSESTCNESNDPTFPPILPIQPLEPSQSLLPSPSVGDGTSLTVVPADHVLHQQSGGSLQVHIGTLDTRGLRASIFSTNSSLSPSGGRKYTDSTDISTVVTTASNLLHTVSHVPSPPPNTERNRSSTAQELNQLTTLNEAGESLQFTNNLSLRVERHHSNASPMLAALVEQSREPSRASFERDDDQKVAESSYDVNCMIHRPSLTHDSALISIGTLNDLTSKTSTTGLLITDHLPNGHPNGHHNGHHPKSSDLLSTTSQMTASHTTTTTTSSSNHHRKASLYTGSVTNEPIEIHQYLHSQSKWRSPLLVRRNLNPAVIEQVGYQPIYALPIQSITMNIDICLDSARCGMTIVFVNPHEHNIHDAIFVLPTINGTVNKVSVTLVDSMNSKQPVHVETAVVSDTSMKQRGNDPIFKAPLSEYIADLFRFPIACVRAHDVVRITVEWAQRLDYNQGRYHLLIPMQFPSRILPSNVNLSEIIQIEVTLNSFMSNIKFGSNSHNFTVSTNGKDNRLYSMTAELPRDITESIDFHIAYYFDCDTITGTVYLEQDVDHPECGHFVMSINPITDQKALKYHFHQSNESIFGRDILFLMDRSGSMSCSSHSKALQALSFGLSQLSTAHNDRFGVVCFNEKSMYFHGVGHDFNMPLNELLDHLHDAIPPKCPLFEAKREHIESARQFVVHHPPAGGCDAVSPLKWAIKTLYENHHNRSIPFVVLITDGFDESDEVQKRLARDLDPYLGTVRILTFGIGNRCNFKFLNLLALRSRGWSDGAMYSVDIKPRMESLMEKCYGPLLKDLSIGDGIAENEHIECSPTNIPDLFLRGSPVTVSGEYSHNALPQILNRTNGVIRICGFTVSGQPKIYELKVQRSRSHLSMPIRRICVMQRLQEWAARHWWNGDLNLKRKILTTSLREKVCSAYTSLVCVQSNAAHPGGQGVDDVSANLLDRDCDWRAIPAMDKSVGIKCVEATESIGVCDSVGDLIRNAVHEDVSGVCCCGCFNSLFQFLRALCPCCSCCR